jgi:hypothetical protein
MGKPNSIGFSGLSVDDSTNAIRGVLAYQVKTGGITSDAVKQRTECTIGGPHTAISRRGTDRETRNTLKNVDKANGGCLLQWKEGRSLLIFLKKLGHVDEYKPSTNKMIHLWSSRWY